MSSDRFPELHCSSCGRYLGELSLPEVEAIIMPDGTGGLCFDCDPDSASTVPGLFWQWRPGDLFVLGDKSFMIAEHFGNGGEMFEIPHTREHARAQKACLVSTYFHKTSPNHGGEVAETENDATCPDCAYNTLVDYGSYLGCPNCGFTGPKLEYLVIPAWILEPKGDDPPVTGGEPICYPCLYTRDLGRGQYCPYHHALLVEQYEDGSLGWGNETQ